MVVDSEAIGCVAPARCFKKGPNKGGIIVDRRAANLLEQPPPPLRGAFASVKKVRLMLARLMVHDKSVQPVFFATVDVVSAYWASQLPFWLKFSILANNRVYHLRTDRMLFGHHWGPHCIHNYLHELGSPRGDLALRVEYAQIIDDMAFFGHVKHDVSLAVGAAAHRIHEEKYVVHPEKSQLEPVLVTPFLGHWVHRLGFTVDAATWYKIVLRCERLLNGEGPLGYHRFMRLCGLLLHIAIHPSVRLRLGALFLRFRHLGLLPVTDAVRRVVQKILALSIVPRPFQPMPLPALRMLPLPGTLRWLCFADAAISDGLGGAVLVEIGSRTLHQAWSFWLHRDVKSQQDAELYAAWKALWACRVHGWLDMVALVVDNSAVWSQITAPKAAVHSVFRRKLLLRIFELPFRWPLMVGWVSSELNPADVLSRSPEMMHSRREHSQQWNDVVNIPLPWIAEDVGCRLNRARSSWLGDPTTDGVPQWSFVPPARTEDPRRGLQGSGTSAKVTSDL